MSCQLVSELTLKQYQESDQRADKTMLELFSSDSLDGVIKGEDRSGWIGTINVGLWPTNGGFEKRYIIHTSFEGSSRKKRNVESDKIKGFFTAKHIMRSMLDETRTVYTPAIKGHKVVYKDVKRNLLNREIYVNYEPRHLAYNNVGVSPEDYAYFLARDMARFMVVGMTNAPRHIRPNYSRDSIRKTCMIDLDQFDPRTFHWNLVDQHLPDSLNYEVLLSHEIIFLRDVASYFLNNLLPDDLENAQEISGKLKNLYLDGFVEEIKNLKGNKAGCLIAERFYI